MSQTTGTQVTHDKPSSTNQAGEHTTLPSPESGGDMDSQFNADDIVNSIERDFTYQDADLNTQSEQDGQNEQNEQDGQDDQVDPRNHQQTPRASASPRQASRHEDTRTEEPKQLTDASDLFVSENETPAPQGPPTPMPPPPRPIARPSFSGASVFARVLQSQKAHKEKKEKSKRATLHLDRSTPDSEDYLQAVLSPIKPPASMTLPIVDPDEMADRQALAEFQRQKQHYDGLRQSDGAFGYFREDVEWHKIEAAEMARRKKRARDVQIAHQPEQSLLPEVRTPADGSDDDSDGPSHQSQASGSSRKRKPRDGPKPVPPQSMQDAELQAMRVALDANEDLPRKKKKGLADADSPDVRKGRGSKAKSKPKPKGPGKKAADGRKSAKDKLVLDHAVKQATSLFNANVFEQQAGQDAADQPTFQARIKTDALKELIASVPIEDKKEARSDISALLNATKDFDGYGSVKTHQGGWLVKGMKTALKAYQVLGSSFMRRRENATERPRGGLMADQMGLGKTLMMLANIVNGLPPKGSQPRTTLLVASPALLTQWDKEIQEHTNCGLSVLRYGAGTRLQSNDTSNILSGIDIILTTYGEIMKSYPKNEPPIECQTAQQKIEWWKEVYDKERGVLHRTMFLRIVLDEAQAIKNHQARTSIACRALMAHHKWALSGTPILNSLTELYPYFKFLEVPHTGSFKIFKNNYCDVKDAENTERLLVRLSTFMIRRTHADKMFNAPILKLPQASQKTFWGEFNPVERCIYDIVHQRFTARINMLSERNELERSYSNALVMLLRLRQLTAHVLMLQFVMKDLLEQEDIERIKEVAKIQAADKNTGQGRTIIAIRKQLDKHAMDEKKKAATKAALASEENEILPDGDDDAVRLDELEDIQESSQSTQGKHACNGGSGMSFGKSFNFKPFLSSLKKGDSWEKAKRRATCSFCGERPYDPWISSCGHLICAAPCLEQSDLEAAEHGETRSVCKTCGTIPTHVQPCEIDEDESVDTVAQGTRAKAAQKKARQRERRGREDISEDWLSLGGADILPSAKTIAIKAQILNWRQENPNVKIIVYTQFLAM